MKKCIVIFILLLTVILAGGCTKKEAQTPKMQNATAKTVNLTVAAAASLKDATNELQKMYAASAAEQPS